MANNLYKRFKTDENAEKNGVWISYDEGVEFLLRRAGSANPHYRTAVDYHMGPYRRRFQNGTVDEKKSRELMARVYADAVVADWKGVTDEAGNILECTKENVFKVLMDLRELFDSIQKDAGEIDQFRAREVAGEAKN